MTKVHLPNLQPTVANMVLIINISYKATLSPFSISYLKILTVKLARLGEGQEGRLESTLVGSASSREWSFFDFNFGIPAKLRHPLVSELQLVFRGGKKEVWLLFETALDKPSDE